MNRTDQIFIVGSSRSGTTMMGRILNNHPDIFTFRELHFFGTIWTNYTSRLNYDESVSLLSRLLCIQERGIFHQKKDIVDFHEEAKKLLVNFQDKYPRGFYLLTLNEFQ